MKFHTEGVQARAYGDTVILTGRVVTEYQRDGQTMSKEQQRYTDTYVRRNGRWQVVASHLSNDTPRQKTN
jgi:ketosteroid isomerase-like protein